MQTRKPFHSILEQNLNLLQLNQCFTHWLMMVQLLTATAEHRMGDNEERMAYGLLKNSLTGLGVILLGGSMVGSKKKTILKNRLFCSCFKKLLDLSTE